MLVIDASVNRADYIDSIMIQRVESNESGINLYKIVKPKGYEDALFKHKYQDGYFPLLKMVVDYLAEQNYKPEPSKDWNKIFKFSRS